jgi:adenine-specific DNA-methyltransferase
LRDANDVAKRYLTGQLIPYLGNKRALLGRMAPVLAAAAGNVREPAFMDIFAGSGAVSRLARSMGMRVMANDWEPYAKVINDCWLVMRPVDLELAFEGVGGVATCLAEWNRMHPLHPDHVLAGLPATSYMSRWYAPVSTECPEINAERLFYTAENAIFMDRVRFRLDQEYPPDDPGSPLGLRRRVILATLLLEAAIHVNTSGVFKAYHRGFGGHSRDALGRIMARMELEVPTLIDGPSARVYMDDALQFCLGCSAAIAYVDPPYNQHQYGTNYHILNTLVRWDGQAVPLDLGADGRLLRKAGIPAAAAQTRSQFCSRTSAGNALSQLFDRIDAGCIIVSWNADAHMKAADLADLLCRRGRLSIQHLNHTSYRGGRQSASRTNRSSEYLFIVDCRKPGGKAAESLDQLQREHLILELLGWRYDPVLLRQHIIMEQQRIQWPDDVKPTPDSGKAGADGYPGPKCGVDQSTSLELLDDLHLDPAVEDRLNRLDGLSLQALHQRLRRCACHSIVHELDVLAVLANAGSSGSERLSMKARREAPRLIRKLAHPKYATDFRRIVQMFRNIATTTNDQVLYAALAALERLAGLRFDYDSKSAHELAGVD